MRKEEEGEEGRAAGRQNRGVLVVSAFEDYAFDYGLQVGDRILSIDGESVQNKDVEAVRNMLRGEPDTKVTLRFERDARRPFVAAPPTPQPQLPVRRLLEPRG